MLASSDSISAANDELLEQLSRLKQENSQLKSDYAHLTERATLLREEVQWLKAQLFGRSSEKVSADISPDQHLLFNEVEVLAAIAAAEGEAATQVTLISAHERKKKPGRKAIPDRFPRIPVLHDILESEKICAHDGTQLQCIGKETAEQYDYVPPKLRVLRHERPKYACPCCHQGVKIAPPPAHILPKCMASPALLAQITTAKFVDGLPLTRQSKQLERDGLSLGAGTMGGWLNTIGDEKVVPLINLMNEALLQEPFIHCDETPLQVLKSHKSPSSDHYMWVRAAGPPGRRIVLFDYTSTRSAAALMRLLTGPDGPYRGKLLSDGLKIYDTVGEAWKLLMFGCLAHARRYYVKAQKVGESPSGRSLSDVAIRDYIGELYKVEREIKALRERAESQNQTLTHHEVLRIRQEKSAPIAAAFRQWLDQMSPGVPPQSALGKAIGYSLSQWEKLVRYIEHPEIPADNNYLENHIRPFAVGRRAWLFADTQRGARASANLYSLVTTAKANGLEPRQYLTHLYTELPQATTAEHLEALLPWNAKALLR